MGRWGGHRERQVDRGFLAHEIWILDSRRLRDSVFVNLPGNLSVESSGLSSRMVVGETHEVICLVVGRAVCRSDCCFFTELECCGVCAEPGNFQCLRRIRIYFARIFHRKRPDRGRQIGSPCGARGSFVFFRRKERILRGAGLQRKPVREGRGSPQEQGSVPWGWCACRGGRGSVNPDVCSWREANGASLERTILRVAIDVQN